LEARSALVDVARSKYYPQLFLGITADYAYAPGRYRQRNPFHGDPFLSRGVRAGVGLRQNLNFVQTRARVEQARAEENEVLYLQDAARQLVLFEVEQAYRNVIIKRAAADARERQLSLSNDWLRTEQVNFDLDLGDTENLVKAVRQNLELQAAEHQAIFEYNRSVLRLWQAMGVADAYIESGMLVE
ncbi:MAG: TolC family protein, partial [Rhodothermales bacterium]|nr:TolC family protein [Rhodothermales bacterium]